MRVLLIMPNFFDYPRIICEELQNMGYEVDCFDDRPSTSGMVKAVIRVNRNLISRYIERYFKNIMQTVTHQKYDVVLLISGQSLSFSEKMIQAIKEAQPAAKFVLYQWDSQKNFPYIIRVQKYFDRCYSFDKNDVSNNTNLQFLPLFYSKRYESIGRQKSDKFKYDFCFVGTAHPKKYKFIKLMSAQLKDAWPKQYVYFFFPSPIVYFYRKFKNPELKEAHYSEFHFTPLNGQEMDTLIAQSRCILDSAQDGQVGLTIRVLEAIGANKKLITTNHDVVNYDFYRSENVYVYDGKFDLESDFFTKPYCSLEKDIYEKYSLTSWLKVLLGTR